MLHTAAYLLHTGQKCSILIFSLKIVSNRLKIIIWDNLWKGKTIFLWYTLKNHCCCMLQHTCCIQVKSAAYWVFINNCIKLIENYYLRPSMKRKDNFFPIYPKKPVLLHTAADLLHTGQKCSILHFSLKIASNELKISIWDNVWKKRKICFQYTQKDHCCCILLPFCSIQAKMQLIGFFHKKLHWMDKNSLSRTFCNKKE